MMMFTYMQTEESLWTVGFYSPSGEWYPESDHRTPEEAIRHVVKLNGGNDDGDLHERITELTHQRDELLAACQEVANWWDNHDGGYLYYSEVIIPMLCTAIAAATQTGAGQGG